MIGRIRKILRIEATQSFPMISDRLIDRKTIRGTGSSSIVLVSRSLSKFSPFPREKERKSRGIAYNTNMLFHPVEIERNRHVRIHVRTGKRCFFKYVRIQLVGPQVWISIPGQIL